MIATEESIGERIRACRKIKGWSLDRLSAESHVSRGTIYEAEVAPDRVPTHATLEKIASALGVTVTFLRTGEIEVRGASLEVVTPELYGRAKGISDPARLAFLRQQVELLLQVEGLS